MGGQPAASVQPLIATGIEAIPPEFRGLAHDALKRAKEQPASDFIGTHGNDEEPIPPIPWVTDKQEYQIGDTTWILREPVIRQEQEIFRLLRKSRAPVNLSLDIDADDIKGSLKKAAGQLEDGLVNAVSDIDSVLGLLDDASSRLFAVILVRKNQRMEDKDFDADETFLMNTMTITQQSVVLTDFFVFARALLRKIGSKLGKRLERKATAEKQEESGKPRRSR